MINYIYIYISQPMHAFGWSGFASNRFEEVKVRTEILRSIWWDCIIKVERRTEDPGKLNWVGWWWQVKAGSDPVGQVIRLRYQGRPIAAVERVRIPRFRVTLDADWLVAGSGPHASGGGRIWVSRNFFFVEDVCDDSDTKLDDVLCVAVTRAKGFRRERKISNAV